MSQYLENYSVFGKKKLFGKCNIFDKFIQVLLLLSMNLLIIFVKREARVVIFHSILFNT